MRGALELASELLRLKLTPSAGAYRVSSAEGEPLGQLELDLFGSERVELLGDRERGSTRARVGCGFEPSDAAAAPRLGHADVEALLRGVGRALFLLLTRADSAAFHGWFGAEIAGDFFARLACRFDTLSRLAPLPRALFERLLASRSLHAGLAAAAALELVLFDLRVHRDFVPAGKATQLRAQVLDTFTQIRREQSVLPAPYWTRFASTATEIFAEGRGGKLWQREWARSLGGELYRVLETSGFSDSQANHLRETFFAPGEKDLRERLRAALGATPLLDGRAHAKVA